MPYEQSTYTIDEISADFEKEFLQISDSSDLEKLRIHFLGRKGAVSELFKGLGVLSADERKTVGQKINSLKEKIQNSVNEKIAELTSPEESIEDFDTTMPGDWMEPGKKHPLTYVFREIKSIFKTLGFSVAEGPEVETEYYNFEALNIPEGHPAREMQDTLYVDCGDVLRTHTSPVQVRVMENQKPPVRIISPGRCFRRDTPGATHSPVFHQVEGLCVDEGITFADLKGVILNFARQMFGSDIKIRFRPSFFPFVEPGAEYDFTCVMCRGKGCRICKGTGWIEISGAGMVNPRVFDYVGYDSEKYTGYAFGMGVERLAMLLFQVHDIRLFYENDIRFLQQF